MQPSVKRPSTSPRALGITKKGTPCKKCLQKGDFCHLHQSQRQCVQVSKTLSSAAVTQERPSQHVNKEELPCKICIRLGKPCVYHEFQTFEFFGITQKGESCKSCILKGGFCRHHEAQRDRELAALEALPSPQTTFGITLKGQPCKICIFKGDFCAHHEMQREHRSVHVQDSKIPLTSWVLGVTAKGTPCKLCRRKGDFCHHHEDQKPIVVSNDVVAASQEEKSPSPLTPFAMTKKGAPCKLCIRKGDICHVHKSQEASKDRTRKTLPSGRGFGRSMSLLVLASFFQCILFMGLHEVASEKELSHSYHEFGLEFVAEQGLRIKDMVTESNLYEQLRSSSLMQSLLKSQEMGAPVDRRFPLVQDNITIFPNVIPEMEHNARTSASFHSLN
jgi:hypothetical protein